VKPKSRLFFVVFLSLAKYFG